MIVRKILKVTEPTALWQVTIPEGACYGRAVEAYDSKGNYISYDSKNFFERTISVDFGFEPVTGSLLYEYEDCKEDTVVEAKPEKKDTGIEININNTNGCEGLKYPEQNRPASFEFKDKTEVIVPSAHFKGFVEVLRNGRYTPLQLSPVLMEPYLFRFTFPQMESGRIF